MDRDPTAKISVLDALTEWCDPAIVEAVRIAERHYSVSELAGFPYPMLAPGAEHRQPTAQDWMIGSVTFQGLRGPWQRLQQDFRDRLERGEFFLQGYLAGAVREEFPRSIPGIWAADLRIDFRASTIQIDKRRFVGVVATSTMPSGMRSGATALSLPAGAALPTSRRGEGEVAPPGTATGIAGTAVRGRESYLPMIRQAVDEMWERLCKDGAPRESWKRMAEWVYKHLEGKYPERAERKAIPVAETIRTRLRRVYEEIAARRGVR
jgi:hypothetical protein